MMSLNGIGSEPKPMLKMAANKKTSASSSLADINLCALQSEDGEPNDLSIVELYQAARDENELLEFKNYELQFKIQELEQNQKRILSAICSNVTSSSSPDSTTIATVSGEACGQPSAPPTRNSSLAGEPSPPATCGRLQEEQSRQQVDTNPLAKSNSRTAMQQCANQSAGQVTSQAASGDRAPDEMVEDVAAVTAAAASAADGHQFSEGLPAAHDATRQRHANESGALLSVAGGTVPNGASEQNDEPPKDVERCQAKVDQLGQQQQLLFVEHENINNEPRQQDERLHDKYELPSPTAAGEPEDVARKTNRRSREPEAVATDRKLHNCPHGAHLIEYNGSAPTQQADQAAPENELPSQKCMQASSLLDGHAASNSADSSLAVGTHLEVARTTGNASQSGDSQLETMAKCVETNQAATKRPAGARIAVPVQRRASPAQQSSSQKNAKATSASTQSAVHSMSSNSSSQRALGSIKRPLRVSNSTAPADPLRSRSKSSLDQKSIRRTPEKQPQWQRPAILRRATSSKRVSSTSHQLAADQVPTVRLSRAASSGQLSSSRKQQSANSFVTHIPTLIGASHAPAAGAAKTPTLPLGSTNSAMMRRIMKSRRPAGANQLADSASKSKSLSNLPPLDGAHDGAAQSADHVTGGRPTSMHGDGRVRVQPSLSLVAASESSRSMGELATEANRPLESSISDCFQCESYRNKVDKLMEEREQLREQITELEELENDSRLMSQNLAQQLLAMEKKLDKSKLELQRLADSESKLRFQNKRLHFELRQRQDCVAQLQHQMNELRSRARTLLRLQRNESATNRKQLVATSQSEDINQKSDLSLAQSKSTGSSSAEDSDSAIDELEKRLSLQSDAGSSTGGTRSHQDKPLVNVSYDSAYSKSSSSSDANSSTNSEADCTEHCAQSAACAASSTEELDSGQSGNSLECSDSSHRSAGAAGSESVEPASCEMVMAKPEATSELILSTSNQIDKCATVCNPSQQQQNQQHQKLDTGRLTRNTETDAITDCVSHQTASVERQSAPLNRISTPTRELTDKQRQLQQAASEQRSSIELALEGVDELEQARDRELEQFLAGQREAVPIKVAIVRSGQEADCESEKVTGNGIGVAVPAQPTIPARSTIHNEQQQQQQSSLLLNGGQLGELIDGLKHEVSSLKMRLVQANTLNDNLIRELKAQHSSVTSGCKGQLEPEGRQRSLSLQLPAQRQPNTTNSCLVHLNNLAQSNGNATDANARHLWNHQAPLMKQAAGQPDATSQLTGAASRRSSVIYVNGLSASVTHHHHHYDRLQQQTKTSVQPDGVHQKAQSAASVAACINCCFHRHQTSDRYSATKMQQQQQLVEWLRFLLDKLHFHHGRTFELVSECQKFAMNALQASYNRQVSFLHHQRVVMAGNQAIQRAAAGGAGDQQHQQHVATGRVVIENCTSTAPTMEDTSSSLYPVRPPPRQRTAAASTNRPLDQRARVEIDPVATLDTPAGVTALQVAQPALSSLVPIYYSCNKQQPLPQPPLQVNNSKQKLSLEMQRGSSKSADSLKPSIIGNGNACELAGKPADIYATVNKATKRPPLMGGVSVLEIGNIKQHKQQDLSNSHLNTRSGINVVPIESANSQKLHISAGLNGHQPSATTGPASGVFQSINQQQRQLAGVRHSLSEDMERFRVHSNGQLLDLLMRQNWCESVISEKIKSLELPARHAHYQRVSTPQRDCGLPNVVNNH